MTDLQNALRSRLEPRQRADADAPAYGSRVLRPMSPLMSELAGLGAARGWGETLAADIAAYRQNQLPWSEVDPGCVLTGPPGTGKTTFAKALAATCALPLVSASFATWQRAGHLNDLIAAMHEDFRTAAALAPSILFIDEIDNFRTRSTAGQSAEYHNAVVNALLQELDGIEGRQGVIVIGACNNVDEIDPAVLRSGRLDRVIRLALPSASELETIYRFHLEQYVPGIRCLPQIAALSIGMSAADAARIVREAKRIARSARRHISDADLVNAIMASTPPLDPVSRRRVAIYEAGKAAAVLGLRLSREISASLARRAAGHASFSCIMPPAKPTRFEVEQVGIALLAGRAAEEVVLGRPSSCSGGEAHSDLAQVTSLFRKALAKWGLATGPLPPWHGAGDTEFELPPALAEELRTMLAVAHERARHRAYLDRPLIERFARHLEQYLVLTHDQIIAIDHEVRTSRAPPPLPSKNSRGIREV